MSEQIKKLVLKIAENKNFGKLNKITKDEKYTFTNKLTRYTSYCFTFKIKESFFYKTNFVQVDIINEMIYVYNPINGETFYYSYIIKETTKKKEKKQWIK